MSEFEALLAVQDQDIKVDQLEHKLATLPERAAVEDNIKAQTAAEEDEAEVQGRRDVIARDQKRIEDEVAIVEAKAKEMNDRLYNQGITSPKELQAIQKDIDSLKRRQSDLEDRVIELMEAAEPLDDELGRIAAQRTTLADQGAVAREELVTMDASVTQALADARAERVGLAAAVSAEQLARYERLRPQFQGIAVARLVGTQCGGCHLTLSSSALEEVRHLAPGAVAHCEECGRMLVV